VVFIITHNFPSFITSCIQTIQTIARLEIQLRPSLILGIGQSNLLLGRIALTEDNIADAERHLTAAVDHTKDLQAPVMAWRIYSALGDLCRVTHRDDEASDNYGAAHQLLLLMAEQAPKTMGRSILESKEARTLGS
jgi:hypothetical protein